MLPNIPAFLDYLLCRQLLNSFILEIVDLRKTKNGQKYVGFSFWGDWIGYMKKFRLCLLKKKIDS
jgi:hypothetical protein